MAKISINIDTQDGVDPFSVHTTRSKRTQVRLLANLLRSAAAHQLKGHPVMRVGTAQASATATLVTAVSGNKLTINGKDLTAAQLHARGTATFSSLANNDTVTVNGVVFTAKTSPTAGSYTEFGLGANDTAAAANLVTKVNAHYSLLGVLTASSASGVVTFRAVNYGTAGNAYTLASSNGTRAAVSAATLANGAAPSGDQWDYGDDDTQGAASLAACINRSTTALVQYVVEATSAAGVVTLKAAHKGLAGNMIAVTKTGSPITLAGVTNNLMTGGTSSVFTF